MLNFKLGESELFRKPSNIDWFFNLHPRFGFFALRDRHLSSEFKWYGHGYTFAEFAQVPIREVSAGLVCEHGNIFWSPPEVDHQKWVGKHIGKTVIVSSEFRVRELQKYGVIAYAIGPYIAYAQNKFDKDTKRRVKESYGRFVLHFPFFRHKVDDADLNILVSEHQESIKAAIGFKERILSR